MDQETRTCYRSKIKLRKSEMRLGKREASSRFKARWHCKSCGKKSKTRTLKVIIYD